MKDIQPGSDYTQMVNKYLRYADILSRFERDSPCYLIQTKNGIYSDPYTTCHMLKSDNKIYDYPPVNRNGKISYCLYDNENNLSNWKYYVRNSKLPLFLGISLNYDMHNNVLKYTPYMTDKIYTDEEIYDKLNFTQEEIDLIEKTVTKFEYNSKFFKKYKNGVPYYVRKRYK